MLAIDFMNCGTTHKIFNNVLSTNNNNQSTKMRYAELVKRNGSHWNNNKLYYLNPTDACHTKANSRKNTGIAGITSTIGRNAAYASGRYDIRKFTFILLLTLYI